MQCVILDDALELEGTQKVVIRTDAALPRRRGRAAEPEYVVLRNGERSCGARVERLEEGSPAVTMDKYLRDHLRARTGGMVEVEPADLPPAKSVELVVPAEYERRGLIALVRDSLVGRPFSEGQLVPLFVTPLTGEQALGQVAATRPAGIVVITPTTELAWQAGHVGEAVTTYQDIGGLRREIERIREIVEYPVRQPEVFRRLGIVPPRGVILFGSPGTGKTLIARALAHEVGASVHAIQGPEIMSAWYGGSEQNLRQVFDQARDQTPAIILIDELDSIAPSRGRSRGDVEHRVVATLLTLMDGLSELRDVVVIGTTNALNAIDPALRRPGRFEHEIHIGVPDTAGRREILAIHTRRTPLGRDVDLDAVAERTHGFAGADLASLCREAAYCALRRCCPELSDGGAAAPSDPSGLAVGQEDFRSALANVRPSAMREVMVEIPRDVSWDDIGGLDEAKQLIVENVVYGLQKRAAFLAVGIQPARGMLLFGPPGTGKTLQAKVTARASGAHFSVLRGPEARSKWFGESEERIRFVFAKAREVAPCVVFLDELDAIAPARGREASGLTDSIVNQLLVELDGIGNNDSVFVIGATNRAELIDPALLRPGRFEYQVLVPLPDEEARRSIFAVHLRNKPTAPDLDLDELARRTGGLSGADIAEACRLATLEALRGTGFVPEGVRVDSHHVADAVERVKDTKDSLTQPAIGFRPRNTTEGR